MILPSETDGRVDVEAFPASERDEGNRVGIGATICDDDSPFGMAWRDPLDVPADGISTSSFLARLPLLSSTARRIPTSSSNTLR